MLLAFVMMVGSTNAAEQVNILTEDFSSITTGDNTTSSGAGTAWTGGNTNFPTIASVYKAGGAVKLGSSSAVGSLTSKDLDLSVNGGAFTIRFSVKGWTTVEGSIKVTVTGLTAQTVTYTSVMAGTFEQKELTFTGGTAGSTVKIETTAKRAYIDDVSVYYVNASPTITVAPATLTGFAYQYGSVTPSAEQSFKVGGTLLTNDVSVAPSPNYEISLATGDLFVATNPITLTQTAGVLTDTPIYVRLKSGLAAGSYSESITVSSTGATSKTVACNGTVACVASSLTFSTASVNKTVGNANFTEMAASTNAITPITYSSSAPTVATVNASTGEVTILTSGSTDISANQISSDGYCANNAKYTLNVVAKDPTIAITEVKIPDMATEVGRITSEILLVGGVNLTAGIGLSITGTNESLFKVSQVAITQTDGTAPSTEVTITYNPIAAGTHTATLTLTSAGAYDTILALKGTSTLLSGISNVYNPLELTVVNGEIMFSASAGESVAIYNSIGQQLLRKKAVDGVNTIEVPAHGVLIVKVGNRVTKVII